MANSYTVKPRQSLFDVALLLYGRLESVFDIALLNGLAVTDNPEPGNELSYPNIPKNLISSSYGVNGVVPATAIDAIDFASTIAGEGVEFWAVETEFLVS